MELETWKKDLFLGHLQPPLDKNSKHLAILILEFDDVTVKTIYSTNQSQVLGSGSEPNSGYLV